MRAGDTQLIVNVTADDIANHQNQNPYKTSLSLAVLRLVEDSTPTGVGFGDIKCNVGGYGYNMDAVSAVFGNLEIAGISLTVPYTATLTIATII